MTSREKVIYVTNVLPHAHARSAGAVRLLIRRARAARAQIIRRKLFVALKKDHNDEELCESAFLRCSNRDASFLCARG